MYILSYLKSFLTKSGPPEVLLMILLGLCIINISKLFKLPTKFCLNFNVFLWSKNNGRIESNA